MGTIHCWHSYVVWANCNFLGEDVKTERELPPLMLGPDFKCKNFNFGNHYFHLHGGKNLLLIPSWKKNKYSILYKENLFFTFNHELNHLDTWFSKACSFDCIVTCQAKRLTCLLLNCIIMIRVIMFSSSRQNGDAIPQVVHSRAKVSRLSVSVLCLCLCSAGQF